MGVLDLVRTLERAIAAAAATDDLLGVLLLEEKVRVAKQNGEFDDGVVDIRGESVKVGPPPRGAAPGDASRTLLGTVP